ncbi:hypothetical protein RB593_001585 [Gaeumannomyces tritici]
MTSLGDNELISVILAACFAAGAFDVFDSHNILVPLLEVEDEGDGQPWRRRYRNRRILAQRRVLALLRGPDWQFKDELRLQKSEFTYLAAWLQNNTSLEPTTWRLVEIKLAVFLEVSAIVTGVLDSMELFHKAVVRLPPEDWLNPTIELDPKENAFNGCIGAIDGTHLSAFIRGSQQRAWYDRQGNITQNVFAAVRSNCEFSYVLAGAEGSMNDKSLAAQAFTRGFHIPVNRYYLGDSGFAQGQGVIVPYPGLLYHLPERRAANRVPETKKELYNLHHASHRSMVERAFGILKRQWRLIRKMAPEYPFTKQCQFIYATTALHNLMQMKRRPSVPLTANEAVAMEAARGRAARVVGGQDLQGIRHTAAILFARQYEATTGEFIEAAAARRNQ